MAKSSTPRVSIVLECEKCKSRNYRTSKNKANTGTRLELKKFCRACNALTTHKETR